MAKPKKINYKAVLIALLVCVSAAVIFLAGLWSKHYAHMGPAEEGPGMSDSAYGSEPEEDSFDLSVWVVYWDWERGMNEMSSIAGMPDSLQAYAATFNASDKLFFTDDAMDMAAALSALREDYPDMPVYLTVANDRMDGNGEWTEKDGRLADRLMKTEQTRANHIEDIVALVQKNGFDGVEINYENISGDAQEGFVLFLSELYSRLHEDGLWLRVVIRPDSSITNAGLPEGPEYVVPAYYFYGAGSQPGPNADEPYIRGLMDRMESVTGYKRIAFATGGFEWDAAGNARQLTETEANELSLASENVQRDVNSGELYFTYTAEDGSTHTVWYADAETLAGWFDLSKSLGYRRVALWRMGGEMPDTLKMLGNLQGTGLN